MMIPDFREVKVNLFCKGAAKVSALLLVGICAFGIVPWNEAAAVCYAKADTDKEKVEEFVTAYYEAHTEKGIETLPDYVADAGSTAGETIAEEMLLLEVCLGLGVEKYDNLDVIAYPLSDGISWLAVVSYELIVEDFDVGIPGLISLMVRKQEDGTFKIWDEYLDNMDDTERENLEEEIWEIRFSDEIYDKTFDVNNRYNTIVSENSDILEWVLDLQDEITQAHVEQMEGISQPETETTKTYIVCEGDCLWSIAKEQLGDGMYWRGIYESNRELIGDDPNLIYVGWELEIDANTDNVAINDIDEEIQTSEEANTYSEEKDYLNPYERYRETFDGLYLYDIYEANKGSEADGDWFVDGSDRFTYYEVYDPFNDEALDAKWEIELAEMKGTDKLAQAVNEYHTELFKDQKEWMQEKQKTVMAMDVEEYRSGINLRHYSNNIRTMASFEWGNIFTVVDMENTSDRRCCPVIANFNKTTGKKYEFDDLFNTKDYREKLLEIIRRKLDGYTSGWEISEEYPFSFVISYHGLLLYEDVYGTSDMLLIEWCELEDILTQEMKTDISEYSSLVSIVAGNLLSEALEKNTDWRRFDYADLDKYPSYYFFSNAYQWAYNLSNESTAATVICAYAEDDSEEGTWELCGMHTRFTDQRWAGSFFARSDKGRELYILWDVPPYADLEYLVMADGIQGVDGSYSYESSLTWKTYQSQSAASEIDFGYTIYVDADAYIYDSTYIDEGVNAMTDYLVSTHADQEVEWYLLDDLIYIGENGYLADMSFSNGNKRVHMMIDVQNKQYSVVEVYDTQEENYLTIDSQVQIDWNDLYIEGTEADFFVNAFQWHYDPQLEKAAACAVKDYAEKIGLEDEEWELTHMYSEDGAVGAFARAKSPDRRLSLLIKGNTYRVIADVQKGDSGEYDLSDGYLSYDSEVKWHSYYEWTINGEKENESVYTVRCNEEYYQHDSIYEYQLNRAMQEYLSTINADTDEEWRMLPEKLFVGCYGSLADAWYTNGNSRVHLVVDVWNKMYAVIAGEDN